MEKFRNLIPANATVIRDGILAPLNAMELVVGDLIQLRSGDKIPGK
jgi:sodium/potassium-transporting ATPase subunit alpha